MASVKRNIKYLNRDFSSFRDRLIEYSKTYFPNTYNDFTPSSPGMMVMEQAAYVGDVLSFYLDNQFQENFLQYARQPNNIFELAYMFGYKPKTTGTAQTSIDFYQQVPAIFSGDTALPDFTYALNIPDNTTITSTNGTSFIISDGVDFNFSNSLDPTQVSVYEVTANSPSNTTLTVRYLTGGGLSSNTPANTLTSINKSFVKFNNNNLNSSVADDIFNSLTVTNPIAASGGKGGDTLEEIRQNTLALIASQKRSVTADDYLVRALSMPSQYGAISKALIEQPKLTDDQVSTIETLNLYCLSYNSSGKLDYASPVLKNNLRTYLSQYRIIGDNIEIRDAYIINVGVNFEIIVLPEFNNNEVLLNCITAIQNYFSIDKWQINQPIMLRDIYVLLDKIRGVQTVKQVKISNKAGTTSGYSAYAYDIEGATQNMVIYPSLDPSIFEVRYPDLDIKGKVVPL